jgi:hypothetical protein
LSVTGTGGINLINGAQPDNVIILEEASNNINWSSTGTFNGILLDGDTSTADRITFSADAPSNVGRVIYINGGIVLGNSASGTFFGPGSAPGPSTFTPVGLGLVACALKLYRRGRFARPLV